MRIYHQFLRFISVGPWAVQAMAQAIRAGYPVDENFSKEYGEQPHGERGNTSLYHGYIMGISWHDQYENAYNYNMIIMIIILDIL